MTENTNQKTSWTTSNNNLNLNNRLLLLESRMLELEKQNTKMRKLIIKLKKSMNLLDSNDEVFLYISKKTLTTIENKENINNEIIVKLTNKMKVINMNFGKMKKTIKKMEKTLK